MSADTFNRLKALGLSLEQIGGVLEVIDAIEKPYLEADAARKANARERVTKWRAKNHVTLPKHNSNVTETAHAGVARGLDNLPTEKISGQKEEKKNTPRDELAAVLDAEHADAVIEHRSRLRKPLTQRAAHLLARKLASVPDPNAAADLMLEKGWQSFEPQWLDRPQPRAAGPPRNGKRNYVDAAMDRMNGHGSEGIFGGSGDAQRVSSGQREPGPDDGHIRGGIAGRYLPSSH